MIITYKLRYRTTAPWFHVWKWVEHCGMFASRKAWDAFVRIESRYGREVMVDDSELAKFDAVTA